MHVAAALIAGLAAGAGAAIPRWGQVETAIAPGPSELVTLTGDLAPGVPNVATLALDGRTLALDLDPHSVRAARYRVLRAGAGGRLTEIAPGPVRTMRGVVRGDVGSFVAASVIDGGLYGRIELGTGEAFRIEPVPGGRGGPAGAHLVCREPAAPRSDVAAGGSVAVAEIAIDADFPYVQRWGGGTEARVNAIVNAMNVQYERDVGITHEIVVVLIRVHGVYDENDPVALLGQFRDLWIEDHQDIDRDVAHLFSGRVTGGAAFPAVICDAPEDGFGYSVVGDESVFACATDLSAHQLGHNWAASHCDCPGWTMHAAITCANRFHPTFTIPTIVTFRDTLDCLGACPADLDGSGDVDFGDVLAVLDAWGDQGGPADLDGSGTVGFDDLLIVLDAWGPCS